MTTKKLFGKRIKSLREGKGWTQEHLAERMNITPNYVSGIECGRENPTFDMLMKLSESLKLEMWELFDYGHEANTSDLRKMLNNLTRETDQEKLKLAVKILRAVTR